MLWPQHPSSLAEMEPVTQIRQSGGGGREDPHRVSLILVDGRTAGVATDGRCPVVFWCCRAWPWGMPRPEQCFFSASSHTCSLCPATAILSGARRGCDTASSCLCNLENFPSEVRTAVKRIQSNELLFLAAVHVRRRSGTQTSR